MQIILILDNIRSNHNVGSIFRTADAFGVEKIYLVGYTPAPVDRFGRAVGEIAKTALGAELTVPWEKFESMNEVVEKLKKENFEILALEQDERSIKLNDYHAPEKVAVVLGNEVGGIEKAILNLCDKIIEIPMRGELARNRLPGDGGKESLNVSVATGIALFKITASNKR